MSTTKKSASGKVSKKRLLCVTLPESLLTATKAYRRKSGFSSMSELLRAAVDRASPAALKKNAQEAKKQVSFRLSEPLYTSLFRTANQSGQSIARIIRTMLEIAPKLGLRPAGAPVPKKKSVAEKKKPAPAASAKKSVPAKKAAPKKRKVSRKR